MTLQTDIRPDGRGYHNISAFSSKNAGIIKCQAKMAFRVMLKGQ